jgi:hypothetical protein
LREGGSRRIGKELGNGAAPLIATRRLASGDLDKVGALRHGEIRIGQIERVMGLG